MALLPNKNRHKNSITDLMAEQFTKDGQEGWFHDRGHWGGYFHTYDRFQVGGDWDAPRRVHIFLPRDYEVSQERCPVIYTNDGDTAFFPGGAYQKTWDMASILTRLYLGNQIRKVIVVAVCPINRDYEYTHAPVKDCEWGGLDLYAAYLAKSVKGFIDANYRTIPDAESTLVLGASHGGLAAFYTAIQYSDRVGCVAAFSPSFWVGVDSMTDSDLFFGNLESSTLLFAASETLSQQDKRLKIYLDWGLVREGGFHNSFIEERATVRGREMRDILVNKFGYRERETLFVVEDPNGGHNEESWAARMGNVLKIFFS